MTVNDVVAMGEKFTSLGLTEKVGLDDDGYPRYRVTEEGRRFIRRTRREHRMANVRTFLRLCWADPWIRYGVPVYALLAILYVCMCVANAVGRAHGLPS